jgi:hypothetical protein
LESSTPATAKATAKYQPAPKKRCRRAYEPTRHRIVH